jgi:levanbiose-producing levanase
MRAADGMGNAEERQPTGSARATSRDVARLVGVSHTAVSFVFNGRAEGKVNLGDLEVSGTRVLDYTGTAYELTCEITWDQLRGAGVQSRRSPDGRRHIDAGVYGDYAFVNRRGTVNPDASGRWQESRSPFDPAARTVKLRILVDRTSVEMFVDDGRYTHSCAAFPYLIDTGLALFSIDGTAVFRNTVIREFSL